jgi:hypothetical protein
MRTTSYCCDRCASPIIENRSALEIKAGELAKRFGEPIDLCGDCSDRFGDWLRSGKHPAQLGLGAPMGGLVAESAVPVG